MAFAPLAALTTRKKGPKIAILVGVVVQIISFLALFFNRSNTISITEDSLLLGVGNSFSMVGLTNMVVMITPQEKMGISTGMNQLFRNVGSVIAPAIAGVLETGYQQAVMVGELPFRLGSLNVIPMFAYFPSATAFDLIYITGIIVAVFTLAMVMLLKPVKIGGNEK